MPMGDTPSLRLVISLLQLSPPITVFIKKLSAALTLDYLLLLHTPSVSSLRLFDTQSGPDFLLFPDSGAGLSHRYLLTL